MSMAERLVALMELDAGGAGTTHFALRGDGAIVFLDKEGWFAVVDTGPGTTTGGQRTENLLMLEGPDGTREEAFEGLVWLAGYRESFPMLEG